MNHDDFVQHFGGIYEHSPWVAECAAACLGENFSREQVERLMMDCVDNASRERQLELIRAHPDLAGKAQMQGELTEASTSEQASAGLDQCTEQEYLEFQNLNNRYKERFQFPFIMAVRNSNRIEILQALNLRVENSYDVEFETALIEIHKIASLRLQAMGCDTWAKHDD